MTRYDDPWTTIDDIMDMDDGDVMDVPDPRPARLDDEETP